MPHRKILGKEFPKGKMSATNSLSIKSLSLVSGSDDHEIENKDKNIQTKTPINARSGKVISEALCTLIQVSDNLNGRLQGIQNSTAEIQLLRQEIVEMNKKLNHIIESIEKSPEYKSTFMKYILS